jgi:hypothetical protein
LYYKPDKSLANKTGQLEKLATAPCCPAAPTIAGRPLHGNYLADPRNVAAFADA